MRDVVNEFTRFGHIVQAVGSPGAPLLLGHKLTGSRDLDVKCAQLEHTHGDLPIIARAAHWTDRARGLEQIDLPARSRPMTRQRQARSGVPNLSLAQSRAGKFHGVASLKCRRGPTLPSTPPGAAITPSVLDKLGVLTRQCLSKTAHSEPGGSYAATRAGEDDCFLARRRSQWMSVRTSAFRG